MLPLVLVEVLFYKIKKIWIMQIKMRIGTLIFPQPSRHNDRTFIFP
nr:MAG TPA: hypothetical protein [Bacteriophage sp.]